MVVNCVSVWPGLGKDEKNMDLQLKNKVFLVTGGSKGIGRAVVLEVLKEGANVITCARNETNLYVQAGAPRIAIINGITASVTDPCTAAVIASRTAVKKVAYMLAQAFAPPIRVKIKNLALKVFSGNI